MKERVDLILAASGWPFVAPNDSISRTDPAAGHGVLAAGEGSGRRRAGLARLVGAPVVHASLVGEVWNSNAAASKRLTRSTHPADELLFENRARVAHS